MSLRSEIHDALHEAGLEGMTKDAIFNACESAENESTFATTLSKLKAEGKVKVISTTEDMPPKAIYGLGDWILHEAGSKAKEPEAAKAAPKAKRAYKKRASSSATPEAPQASPAPTPAAQDEVAFALNERGELGLEQDGKKIVVSNAALLRLQGFLEKTEDVWKRSPR